MSERYFTIAYDVPAPVYGKYPNGDETEAYLNIELNKTAIEFAPCKLISTFLLSPRDALPGKRLMTIWERIREQS